jgi:hypothetical protein
MGSWLLHLTWRYAKPLFPFIRGVLGPLHRRWGRQRYLLGYLAPGWTAERLANHLRAQGFDSRLFPSWVDEGEAVGLRRRDGTGRQYHLRIFHDGEVRGHYEYTPGASPWRHFWEVGFEPRRAEFFSFLGPAVVPADERLGR